MNSSQLNLIKVVRSRPVSREPGEQPGRYVIKQGTLTNDANPNYRIYFKEGQFVINQRLVNNDSNPAIGILQQPNSSLSNSSVSARASAANIINQGGVNISSSNNTRIQSSGGLELVSIDDVNIETLSVNNSASLLPLYVVDGGIMEDNSNNNN